MSIVEEGVKEATCGGNHSHRGRAEKKALSQSQNKMSFWSTIAWWQQKVQWAGTTGRSGSHGHVCPTGARTGKSRVCIFNSHGVGVSRQVER